MALAAACKFNTPSQQESYSQLHQACYESIQTLSKASAWWGCLLSVLLSEHTVSWELSSESYPGYNCHEVPGSLWALAALIVTVYNCGLRLCPESSFRSHTASLQVVLAAIYSASAVLWAMKPCFLLDQIVIAESRLKQYPEVLFRSTTLSIQAESVKPCNITPPLDVYLRL